jgi:hypothetical protein
MILERSECPHMIAWLELKSFLVRGSVCSCLLCAKPAMYNDLPALKVCMPAQMVHGHVQQELSCVSFILALLELPSIVALSCFTRIILHVSNVCMSGAYCQTQAGLFCNHKLWSPRSGSG